MKPVAFPTRAAEWNAFIRDEIATLQRERLLDTLALQRQEWQHPWHTTLRWNAESKRFEAQVRPGFVNGLDVTTNVDANDVPLTEQPSLPLIAGYRKIGSDADPTTSTVSDDGTVTLGYEAVPEFFLARGVQSATLITVSAEAVLAQATTPALPARRLVATDLVLYQDRPGLATSALDAATLTATIRTAANARTQAYLRNVQSYTADALPDPLQQFAGNWTDTTNDSVRVCTIYLLSPSEAAADAPVDDTWQPFVQHNLFWNLLYRHSDTMPITAQPLTFTSGLVAGLADQFAVDVLAQNNADFAAALAWLTTNRVEGRFWSV